MCSKTTVAPLDRIKILLQAHSHHYKHLGNFSKCNYLQLHFNSIIGYRQKNIVFFFAGVFSGLKEIIYREHFFALYKGNFAQMVRIFPYAATQFTAFEIYKKVREIPSDYYGTREKKE